MGLTVRRRKRKRIGPFERVLLPKPTATNQSWSKDFVADGLGDAVGCARRSSMTSAANV
jgi:hypothetical protein